MVLGYLLACFGGVRSALAAVMVQDPVSPSSDSDALAHVLAGLAAQKDRDDAHPDEAKDLRAFVQV